jgi:hypothetical protein
MEADTVSVLPADIDAQGDIDAALDAALVAAIVAGRLRVAGMPAPAAADAEPGIAGMEVRYIDISDVERTALGWW